MAKASTIKLFNEMELGEKLQQGVREGLREVNLKQLKPALRREKVGYGKSERKGVCTPAKAKSHLCDFFG